MEYIIWSNNIYVYNRKDTLVTQMRTHTHLLPEHRSTYQPAAKTWKGSDHSGYPLSCKPHHCSISAGTRSAHSQTISQTHETTAQSRIYPVPPPTGGHLAQVCVKLPIQKGSHQPMLVIRTVQLLQSWRHDHNRNEAASRNPQSDKTPPKPRAA